MGVEDLVEYLLAEIAENYCTVPNMAEFSAIAERIMQHYSLDQPTTFEKSLYLYYTCFRPSIYQFLTILVNTHVHES